MTKPPAGHLAQGHVLRDVLKPNLKAVFCGSAAGTKSAQVGAYYAGRGNEFWPILHKVGLTCRKLSPHEFKTLLDCDLGLTDLNKVESGSDKSINRNLFDVDGLVKKIERYAPRVLAFNGKKAATVVSKNLWNVSEVNYGQQFERKIGASEIFVLPSTAGTARRWWDEGPWWELAAYIGQPSA